MPGTFSPPPRISDPDTHHGTCMTHVPGCMPESLTSGILCSWWRGKRSRHSRRMRNPQFYISGKRPMGMIISLQQNKSKQNCVHIYTPKKVCTRFCSDLFYCSGIVISHTACKIYSKILPLLVDSPPGGYSLYEGYDICSAISTPLFRSLENLYSFDPYILAKMRKMSYFDPYFSSKFGKMHSFDPSPPPPFFLILVAFRVNGRCWASLSETWPSTRYSWMPDIGQLYDFKVRSVLCLLDSIHMCIYATCIYTRRYLPT